MQEVHAHSPRPAAGIPHFLPALAAALVAVAIAAVTAALGQQVADTEFAPHVGPPAYPAGDGPVVLVDEGHVNFHTIGGRYQVFAKTLRQDGYDVRPLAGRFTRESLQPARVLVISNALAARNAQDWSLPTPSAFDSTEVETVRDWVHEGGSLLLIADHMPFAGAAERLAAAFGVLFGNGFAMDRPNPSGIFRYARSDGSLADDAVTRGRSADERVDSVMAFTGSAFRLEPDLAGHDQGDALLRLPADATLMMPVRAWAFSDTTPRISAAGMLQGATLRFGSGRVAVFGEAAMFTAQLAGPNRVPVGMNDPRAPQNAQFLLNVMHWLSGLLG